MNYSFHPEAEIEFNNAIDYYEECKEGLGLEFTVEELCDFGYINLKFVPKVYPFSKYFVNKTTI
jgi:hypothetical protein